jgi:hypothetical protein
MVVTLLVLAALVVLMLIHLRDSARQARRHGTYFSDALGLFDSYRVTQAGKAWPVLTGRYKGRDVRLEPVLDDMTWRKLPSLWLKTTLLSSNPARGTLGFMVRAQGGEFYSPTGEMAHRLASPAQWPTGGLLCTDDVKTAPLSPALDAQMVAFTDPRMKELVITPRGVRLVYQAAQASRAEYLVLRRAHFTQPRLDATLARALLDRVLAIAAAVDAPAPARRNAA